MQKSIKINISEDQINALKSVFVDVLDYYRTLKSNSTQLECLRKATELSSHISNKYYDDDEKVEIQPDSYKIPIEKLALSLFTKKLLTDVSILSVGDLVQYSIKDLFKIRYLKSKRLHEIEKQLKELGLKLAK